MQHVTQPTIHLRAILPLLGIVSAIPARKLLLELYGTVVERSTEDCREILVNNYNLISALNAWDSRWLDQPDFQERLDAFSEINNAIEKNEITLEFGVAIIHNCYYFLKTETDLALRDYSGQCLNLLGPKLAKEHKENTSNRRYLIDDTILMLIKSGITSKNEVVRLQSIAFLGHMATECAEVHPVLRDLSLLTNKQDPEVDFFENMQHLQLHRRGRALLKFCTVAKTLKKKFNPRTLTQFILPLASMYLCNESFIHKNSIIDAAIETVGTVCRLLPWYQYEIILKHYLEKLKSSVVYQKQLVRIIVIILDSFHFNLSKYKHAEGSAAIKGVEQSLTNEISSDKKKESVENDDEIVNQEIEGKLEETLNSKGLDDAEETVEKGHVEIQEDVPIIERQIVLSPHGAQRVIFTISKDLLPQLHRAIIAKTSSESSHKVNKKKVAGKSEDEELMRVPIALAMVKLLQKLPESILDINLPGIFMKLCTFLKSRLESVRRVTREILQKVMITLGPKYLHYLLREMNTLLTKGFQVHVLAFTVQSVLVALKPYFQKFDMNQNLQSILSVCKVDLFGLTGEEKEVLGIVKTVTEAKSTKSFDIFHILAQYITESCLVDLILPLKKVLVRTHSRKTLQKVVECLRNVVLGLADNTFIPLEQMLTYIGLLSRIQQRLDIKKTERRKTRTQQYVTDPELAAKRKIARQQKKKEATKRKLDTMSGKKGMKKRPKKEIDLDVIV